MSSMKNLTLSKYPRTTWITVLVLLSAALAILAVWAVVSAQVSRPHASFESENGVLAGCASVVGDASASGGQAAVIGVCNTADEYFGLDPSGTVIPATNYSIPSGAIFMSPNGNDNNNGTQSAPVKTIRRAVALVPDGGTIVMRGGEYRDWHSNASGTAIAGISKGLTIQAYPGESPWFNGADIVSSGWASEGSGRWSRAWETPSFCDGQYYNYSQPPYTPRRNPDGSTNSSVQNTACMYGDNANDPNYPMAGNPQMVFVNDQRLQEVNELSKVTASTFYYDWSARKIYIGTNPSGKTVELTARQQALIMGGADNNHHIIRGVGFKKYATINRSGSGTGAIYLSRRATVENVVFTQMAANALGLSSPKPGSSIKNTIFAFNGGNGIYSNGSSRSGARNDLLIENNVFYENNIERFGTHCDASCAAAHIKLAHFVGYTIKNNTFENLYVGNGVWCDLDCRDGVIVGNLIKNIADRGIFDEVSRNTIIASNLIIGNGREAIQVSSAAVKVYNNTIITNQQQNPSGQGIGVTDDGRYPGMPMGGGGVWDDVGPNTRDVELVNNILVGTGSILIKITDMRGNPNFDMTKNTLTEQYLKEMNYNAYYRNASNNGLYNWIHHNTSNGGMYMSSVSQFTATTGWDAQAIDAVSSGGGSNTFFINPATGDYRVKTTSPVYNNGKPLPADVAAVLGLQPGAVISRGALNWPGRL